MQWTETGSSQLARANSGSYSFPTFLKSLGKAKNQADINRSHSLSGYWFKLNPEPKAAESLLFAEGYLIANKKLARNKSYWMEHLFTAIWMPIQKQR